MHRGKTALILLAFWSSALIFPLITRPSRAGEVPADLQAALVFKILSYDSELASRSPSEVNLVLVLDIGNSNKKLDYMSPFEKLSGKKVQGKSLRVAAIDFESEEQLASAIGKSRANVVYLPPGASDETTAIVVALAEKTGFPVFGGSEKIANAGSAVGFAVENSKPKIVVNLTRAKAQGMQISSKVLRLAKIIE